MSGKLPVTILTGFLGAGKTTLLQSLVSQDKQSAFAILVNEFGQISIDGSTLKTVQRNGIEIFELSNGLIAYSGDDQMAETLDEIISRRSSFDCVLIETSGLAVPTAIIEFLQRPEYKDEFVLDAVLTVVDTPYLLSQKDWIIESEREVFVQQLKCADVVVLNKIDRLDQDQLLAAESAIRQLASSVRFVELARNARLELQIALGLRLNQPAHKLESVGTAHSKAGHTIGDGHSHSGLTAHEHGLLTHEHLHQHDPAWLSFSLHSHESQEQSMIEEALATITAEQPVLRLKGSVICSNRLGSMMVQGVRSRLVLTEQSRNEGASQIVFIGHNLQRATVANTLSRITGTVWS